MPFLAAVVAGLVLAVVINVGTLLRRQPLMVLEAGTAVVFAVFVIMALALPEDFLERWLQPLGNAGLFTIVLISILIGKPYSPLKRGPTAAVVVALSSVKHVSGVPRARRPMRPPKAPNRCSQ